MLYAYRVGILISFLTNGTWILTLRDNIIFRFQRQFFNLNNGSTVILLGQVKRNVLYYNTSNELNLRVVCRGWVRVTSP